jgi:hypothetical protein
MLLSCQDTKWLLKQHYTKTSHVKSDFLDDFWCVSPISKVALHQYKPLTIEYFLLDYLMVKQNALLRY